VPFVSFNREVKDKRRNTALLGCSITYHVKLLNYFSTGNQRVSTVVVGLSTLKVVTEFQWMPLFLAFYFLKFLPGARFITSRHRLMLEALIYDHP